MKLPERFDQLEKRMGKVELHCAEMVTANRLSTKLIKYVILPLIIILGGLIGIKIFWWLLNGKSTG